MVGPLLPALALATSVAAAVAPSARPFHVVRSTRWPCLQFGEQCTPPGSHAFAGALIMRNDTGVGADGSPCNSGTHHADPLDGNCFTSPVQVRDSLASVPVGQRLIGMIDGESDMGGATLSYPQFWDPLPGGFAGPWADKMTASVSSRWQKWLASSTCADRCCTGGVDLLQCQ